MPRYGLTIDPVTAALVAAGRRAVIAWPASWWRRLPREAVGEAVALRGADAWTGAQRFAAAATGAGDSATEARGAVVATARIVGWVERNGHAPVEVQRAITRKRLRAQWPGSGSVAVVAVLADVRAVPPVRIDGDMWGPWPMPGALQAQFTPLPVVALPPAGGLPAHRARVVMRIGRVDERAGEHAVVEVVECPDEPGSVGRRYRTPIEVAGAPWVRGMAPDVAAVARRAPHIMEGRA